VPLDPQAKKVALRAINYGLYVVTAKSGDELAAAGVNWLTQASFEPPLVVAGIKTDNDSHRSSRRPACSPSTCSPTTSSTSARRSSARRPWRRHDQRLPVRARTRDGVPAHRRPPVLVRVPRHRHRRARRHTVFVGEVVGAGMRDESAVPLLLRDTGMNYGG